MGLMDNLKKGIDRAREEATDLAQTAMLRREIGKLEDRKTRLFETIGRSVYESAERAEPAGSFDAELAELRGLDVQIREKEAEITRIRSEEGSTGGS